MSPIQQFINLAHSNGSRRQGDLSLLPFIGHYSIHINNIFSLVLLCSISFKGTDSSPISKGYLLENIFGRFFTCTSTILPTVYLAIMSSSKDKTYSGHLASQMKQQCSLHFTILLRNTFKIYVLIYVHFFINVQIYQVYKLIFFTC